MNVPPDIMDRLLAECVVRPRAYDALGTLCDEVGGRVAGTPQGARAEAWATEFLTRSGLDTVWREPVPVRVWTRGTLTVTVVEPTQWSVAALAHGYAPCTADVTADVVDAGHCEREQLAALGAALPGRIALCDEDASPGKRRMHRTEKLALAAEFGAAGLMIVSGAAGCLARTGVCWRGEAPIPSVGIALEDGARMQRLLASGVTPRVRIAMANQAAEGTACSVFGDLRGTEHPDEVVLAGGHLDSWDVAQGATDNGLGSAIVLEMARALACVARPRRTLRFALWAAEEVGLLGSRQYVRDRAEELDLHAAVLNFDMTGDPYGYWTPGHADPAPLLVDLARRLAPLGMEQQFASGPGLHSDHAPFMLAGVPVIGLQGRLPEEAGRYYHTTGDTFEKVSQPGLCRAAVVGAVTAWAVADAPARTWPRLTQSEVDAMIDKAGLREAVDADG